MRPALLLLRGGALAMALSALGAPAGAAEPDAETAKRLAALTAERDELARRVAEQAAWLEAAAEEQRALLARLRSLAESGADPVGAEPAEVAREAIATETEDVAAMRGHLQGLGAQLEVSRAESAALRGQLQGLEAQLGASREESRELASRLAMGASDRADLVERIAELTTRLEASRAELDRVRAGGVLWASTTAAVNLRSGPGTDHRRLQTLPVGTRVELMGRIEDWARVRAANREGWVAAEYLRAESDETGALRARIRELEDGLAAARRAASAATAELQAMREAAEAQRAAQAEQGELAARLRRLEAEGRDGAARAAELERQLSESSEARARLTAQLGQLAARNSALEAANAALETSRRDLAAELASAQSEAARRDRQRASQTEEIRQRLQAAESVAAELVAWLEGLQVEKTAAAAD